MVAVRDFSGLTSSAWALAKAEASAATDSLDRGIGGLRLKHIKAHRPRFRALGFHAVPDCLLGILGHQGFELAFRPFVVEKGTPGVSEERGELRPGIRRTHIDDADGGRGGSALIRWGLSPDWTQRQNFFSAETRTLR